jgi:WD40 repeat protein
MAIAYTPGGDRILAGDNSGHVRAWRTDTGMCVADWQTDEAVADLAVHPTGRWLLSCDAGSSALTLFDLGRSGRSERFRGDCRRTFSVAFLQGGQLIVAGCADGRLELIDFASRRSLGFLHGHRDYVEVLAPDSELKRLLSGGADGRVIEWDLDLGSWQRRACRRANRELQPSELHNSSASISSLCHDLLTGAPTDDEDGFVLGPIEPTSAGRPVLVHAFEPTRSRAPRAPRRASSSLLLSDVRTSSLTR